MPIDFLKVRESEATLRSLKNDVKDLPPIPLLGSLIRNLKRQSSRIREAADETAERIEQNIGMAKEFASQQELLASSLAEARSALPIQHEK